MANSPEPIVPTKTNFDLLLEHLPEDSLAAAFVTAHVNRGATSSVTAIRQVVKDRLAALKDAHAERADQ